MRFISLIILVLTCSFSARASEPVRIISVNEPPANFINKAGYPDGLVVDIVQALQDIVGNESIMEFIPEARALNIMDSQANVLFFSISRTQFREDKYHWVGKVFSKNWQVFTKVDSELHASSLQDLANINAIGVVRGDVREEWLVNRKFTNLYSVTQHDQNVQLLLWGRLPAIVYEQQGLTYSCEQLLIDCGQFKAIYTLHQSDVYLVMSKKTPQATLLKWQQAYQKLLSSGEIAAISQKWHHHLLNNLNITSKKNGDFLTF